ncbi:MAG: hypothetical protein Alis3KO_25610 [Aliiglaciecola sp.]
MQVVKFVVDLFPDSTKTLMRKHRWLHNLYSKGLQKSGFFYGFPTPQKLQKLYEKTIERQSTEIISLVNDFSNESRINVGLFLVGTDDIDVAGIEHLLTFDEVNKVILFGDFTNLTLSSDLKKSTRIEFYSGNSRFGYDDSRPCLLLKSVDRLQKEGIKVFLKYWLMNNSSDVIIYSDRDFIDQNGRRSNAECLPSWNPDLHLSSGYLHTGLMFSGSGLYQHFFDVLNRVTVDVIPIWIAQLYLDQIDVNYVHIPLSLLHQNKSAPRKWYRALEQLDNNSFGIKPDPSSGIAKLLWQVQMPPLVTLIIPTKNAKHLVKTCIDSIIEKTSYKNFEILLVDNNSNEPESLDYFSEINRHEKINVIEYPFPFNYSSINNFAVGHAKGSIIGLINNDIEVISPDWLTYMVGHVCRPEIGCVGAKLLYPDNRIQHAGVVMGYGGGAGHAHKYFPRYHAGYLHRLGASNNFSAVTAACLLVKKRDFLAVNGLDEENLSVAFNDVDFCLKVLELGRHNLYCAEAVLYHHESISRGADDTKEKYDRFQSELAYMQHRWKKYIDQDPAYNPNLTLRRENFAISE